MSSIVDKKVFNVSPYIGNFFQVSPKLVFFSYEVSLLDYKKIDKK